MLRRLRNCSWQENMGFFNMNFFIFFFCWSPDWLNLTYDAKESMSIIYSAEPSLLTNWLVLWFQYKLLEATYWQRKAGPNWKQSPSHYEQLFATLTAKLTNELKFSLAIYKFWRYSIRIKTVDNGSCQNSPGQTSKRFVVTWQTISEHLHKQLRLDSRTTRTLYKTTGFKSFIDNFFNVKDI